MLTKLNEGLRLLVDKAAVVATHVGVFDEANAENTYERYRNESATFVVSPDILRYQRQFVQTVLEEQTTIACLVAPFGYGKTSTAISIWNACQEANLLAIPPFSCNSIAEMGQAIATALIYRLETLRQHEYANRIEKAFDKYLSSSAQQLAEKDAEHYGIPIEVALQSIEDKIKSGHLQLEASANHLLSFLEALVAVTLEAGFKGLVIIVDEFQQFLGNINKGVITNFRTLIWGLQTRGKLPLGFLITMDPDTERNLTDRGADILHRIRNHGLYLSFSSIYDREFPRELWSRYAEAFGFTKESHAIVDHATLEAIGQICERPDLSNGPRTVINAFQRIAALQLSRSKAYSPIDLINDFLSGEIRFDGDRAKIASLVNEITSYDYIKRSHERIETIKLVAAFPRGCPPEVADKYALREAYHYLLNELRGEIFVELPEGAALVDLQKVGKPSNKLNIILKKYWLQITEEDIISDKALEYFAQYGVGPLFSDYVSPQNGWKPETNGFILTPEGGYLRVYEGTFFEEYPRRRIAVQICFSLENLVVPNEYVDAQFVFLIQRQDVDLPQPAPRYDDIPTYVITIPIHQAYTRHLPRDIRDIETFLSPVILSPGVLVSLLNYIAEQVPKIEGMSEQEHQRILDTHLKLQEFLLTMSISDQTFAPYEISIYSRGRQAFRDALFHILRERYPNYQSLMRAASWRRLLDQYRDSLEKLTGAQRRGIEPVAASKSELAMLFEQRQHAGFESYIRQYNGLVEITDWRGDTGAITFHRHPQENVIIEAISVAEGLEEEAVYLLSREQGYLYEETQYLINFLLLRGYVEYTENNQRLSLASTFTRDELMTIAQQSLDELTFIESFSHSPRQNALQLQITELLSSLTTTKADLSDVQVQILQSQRHIESECQQITIKLRDQAQVEIENLYKYQARFDSPLAESSTGNYLDSHINGAQRQLQKDINTLSAKLQKQISMLRESIKQSIDLDFGDFAAFKHYVETIVKQIQATEQEKHHAEALSVLISTHQDWIQLLNRLKRLKDMINAAAHITDTAPLEQTLGRIQWDIQQELASEGIKDYRVIYTQFIEQVNDIQRELETLARLAETQMRHTASAIEKQGDNRVAVLHQPLSPSSTETIAAVQDTSEEIKLQSIFESSGQSEQEFLYHLIELNEAGELVIYKRKKRE